MPELSLSLIGIATAAALLGIVVGWLVRGKRSAQEKNAITSGWKEQIEAQRGEHGRLVDQNKSLMEQVNQYKASSKDATGRANELSEVVKEAFARRDELQREIKDVRASLESVLAERKRLESNTASQSGGTAADGDEKDDKIFRLSRELESWQNRLPPLIEKFRNRDEEARQLESELEEARARIEDLQSRLSFDQTLVEPAERVPEELDASNETIVESMVESMDDDAIEAVMDADDEIDASSGNGAELHPTDESDGRGDDASAIEVNGERTLRDDLQMIKGVGPAIEKTLNELGIFRYSQIAGMSEYDIDRVAKRLKGFRSRIYREDWIGQARELDDLRAGSL